MPFCIRPIDNIQNNFTNNLSIFSFTGAEENKNKEIKMKFLKSSEKQRNLLYTIWNENQQKFASYDVQKILNIPTDKRVYVIPNNLSLMDITDLISSGLIENAGNNSIRFTKAGEMALSKAIMAQPSIFESSFMKKANKISKFSKTKISKFSKTKISKFSKIKMNIPNLFTFAQTEQPFSSQEIINRQKRFAEEALKYMNYKINRQIGRPASIIEIPVFQETLPRRRKEFAGVPLIELMPFGEIKQSLAEKILAKEIKSPKTTTLKTKDDDEDSEPLSPISLESLEKTFPDLDIGKEVSPVSSLTSVKPHYDIFSKEDMLEMRKSEIAAFRSLRLNNNENFKIALATFCQVGIRENLAQPLIGLLIARKELDNLLQDYNTFLINQELKYSNLVQNPEEFSKEVLTQKLKTFEINEQNIGEYVYLLKKLSIASRIFDENVQNNTYQFIHPISQDKSYDLRLKRNYFEKLIARELPVNKFFNNLRLLIENFFRESSDFKLLTRKKDSDKAESPIIGDDSVDTGIGMGGTETNIANTETGTVGTESDVTNQPGFPTTTGGDLGIEAPKITGNPDENTITSHNKFHKILLKYSQNILSNVSTNTTAAYGFLQKYAITPYYISESLLKLLEYYTWPLEKKQNIKKETMLELVNNIVDEYDPVTQRDAIVTSLNRAIDIAYSILEEQNKQKLIKDSSIKFKQIKIAQMETVSDESESDEDIILTQLKNNLLKLIENKQFSEKQKRIYRDVYKIYGDRLLSGLTFKYCVNKKTEEFETYHFSEEEIINASDIELIYNLKRNLLIYLSKQLQNFRNGTHINNDNNSTDISLNSLIYKFNILYVKVSELLYNICYCIAYTSANKTIASGAQRLSNNPATVRKGKTGTTEIKLREMTGGGTNYEAILEIAGQLYQISLPYFFPEFTLYDDITKGALKTGNFFKKSLTGRSNDTAPAEFLQILFRKLAPAVSRRFCDTHNVTPWGAQSTKNKEIKLETIITNIAGEEEIEIFDLIKGLQSHIDMSEIIEPSVIQIPKTYTILDRIFEQNEEAQTLLFQGNVEPIIINIMTEVALKLKEWLGNEDDYNNNYNTIVRIADELSNNQRIINLGISEEDEDEKELISSLGEIKLYTIMHKLGALAGIVYASNLPKFKDKYIFSIDRNTFKIIIKSKDPGESSYKLLDEIGILKDVLYYYNHAIVMFLSKITFTPRKNMFDFFVNISRSLFSEEIKILNINVLTNINKELDNIIQRNVDFSDYEIYHYLIYIIFEKRIANLGVGSAGEDDYIEDNVENSNINLRELFVIEASSEMFKNICTVFNKLDIERLLSLIQGETEGQARSLIYNYIANEQDISNEIDNIILKFLNEEEQEISEKNIEKFNNIKHIIISAFTICCLTENITTFPAALKKFLLYDAIITAERANGQINLISGKLYVPVIESEEDIERQYNLIVDLALENYAKLYLIQIEKSKNKTGKNTRKNEEILEKLILKVLNSFKEKNIELPSKRDIELEEDGTISLNINNILCYFEIISNPEISQELDITTSKKEETIKQRILNKISKDAILRSFLFNKSKEAVSILSFNFLYKQADSGEEYLCNNSFIDKFIKNFIFKMIIDGQYFHNMYSEYKNNKIVQIVANAINEEKPSAIINQESDTELQIESQINRIYNNLKSLIKNKTDIDKFISDSMQIFITRFVGMQWKKGALGGTSGAEGTESVISSVPVFNFIDMIGQASCFNPIFLSQLYTLINTIYLVYEEISKFPVLEGYENIEDFIKNNILIKRGISILFTLSMIKDFKIKAERIEEMRRQMEKEEIEDLMGATRVISKNINSFNKKIAAVKQKSLEEKDSINFPITLESFNILIEMLLRLNEEEFEEEIIKLYIALTPRQDTAISKDQSIRIMDRFLERIRTEYPLTLKDVFKFKLEKYLQIFPESMDKEKIDRLFTLIDGISSIRPFGTFRVTRRREEAKKERNRGRKRSNSEKLRKISYIIDTNNCCKKNFQEKHIKFIDKTRDKELSLNKVQTMSYKNLIKIANYFEKNQKYQIADKLDKLMLQRFKKGN